MRRSRIPAMSCHFTPLCFFRNSRERPFAASVLSWTSCASCRLAIDKRLPDVVRDLLDPYRIEPVGGEYLHLPPEELLEVAREAEEIVIGGPLEFDEEVDVAPV